MPCDKITSRLVVINLEDVEWLEQPKRPRPLQPTTGNSCHVARARNIKQRRVPSLPATCTSYGLFSVAGSLYGMR
ncbi:hypothetical protein BDV19DRAFT_363779 [Aspergillus venezuelensis]